MVQLLLLFHGKLPFFFLYMHEYVKGVTTLIRTIALISHYDILEFAHKFRDFDLTKF